MSRGIARMEFTETVGTLEILLFFQILAMKKRFEGAVGVALTLRWKRHVYELFLIF
jgi:hypothetical protein